MKMERSAGKEEDLMADDKHDKRQWYFNTLTRQAELGRISPISRRMGPYGSREQALNAWKIVAERNKRWDEEDRRWREAYDDPDDGDSTTGDRNTRKPGRENR